MVCVCVYRYFTRFSHMFIVLMHQTCSIHDNNSLNRFLFPKLHEQMGSLLLYDASFKCYSDYQVFSKIQDGRQNVCQTSLWDKFFRLGYDNLFTNYIKNYKKCISNIYYKFYILVHQNICVFRLMMKKRCNFTSSTGRKILKI